MYLCAEPKGWYRESHPFPHIFVSFSRIGSRVPSPSEFNPKLKRTREESSGRPGPAEPGTKERGPAAGRPRTVPGSGG